MTDEYIARRRMKEGEQRGYAPSSLARSLNMAAVKRADTKPELALRRGLHAMGYRFRKDYPIRLGGQLIRPDIAFTRRRIAIFVDGCYWHCCPRHGQVPLSNSEYWKDKLLSTSERDRTQDRLLRQAQWQVLRIWEHDKPQDAIFAVVALLEQELAMREPPEKCC